MHRRRAPTGHALLVSVVLLAILAFALTAVFATQTSASRSAGDMIGRRKAFYACDGINRSMVKLAQEYLANTATPDSTDLATYVCTGAGMGDCAGTTKLPTLTPPGFTVTDFSIGLTGSALTAPLPSGPFQGMNARQTPVSLSVRAQSDTTGHACSAEQTIVLAQVGLFQFFVFAEDFVDIYMPPMMTIDGRVHVNGDFCGFGNTSSSTALYIKRLTASGRIFMGSDSCPRARFASTSSRGIFFWDGNSWEWMDKDNDSGCTGCAGGWASYAISTWGGNVQDEAHKVPVLKVPVSGDPPMQDGLNMVSNVQNNAKTQRFLIDPPLFSGMPTDPAVSNDSSEVRRQKLACKADLRIINGVWYKRAPGDEDCSSWPGTPIWSDHPGTFAVTANEEEGLVGAQDDIGQVDLAGSWTGLPDQRPRRYSYFEAEDDGSLISDNSGVISYGTLNRTAGTPPRWKPPANHLDATRGGFIDARINYSDTSHQYILPVNFDVEELAAALNDTTTGELGDHFYSDGFNGIVWIGYTWNGQLDGIGNNGDNSGSKKLAALWPDPRGATLVPYPLCSDDSGVTGRECSSVSRPSALRIINGYTVDPGVFPEGLTIATNLPAYVVGDFNKHSADVPGDWRPVLVAADAVTLLSSDYDDSEADWSGLDAASDASRKAADTHYQLALLTGDVSTAPGGDAQPTLYGGGINNFPRFLENWTSRAARIRGSMVMAFRSVFHRQKFCVASGSYPGCSAYTPPQRDWAYDTNFDVITNQPPGAPIYEVQAIRRWRRR